MTWKIVSDKANAKSRTVTQTKEYLVKVTRLGYNEFIVTARNADHAEYIASRLMDDEPVDFEETMEIELTTDLPWLQDE
tara:strand:- start:40 stop:276 length:237 start_codon:yes stop_codon:yes gene_type:complete